MVGTALVFVGIIFSAVQKGFFSKEQPELVARRMVKTNDMINKEMR